MPDRRPRHASSETDMPHRTPTCPFRDRHAPSEPHWRPTCLQSPIGVLTHIYLNILIFINFLLILLLYWNNVRTPIRHFGPWWVFDQASRSPMCPWLGMYVGLWPDMSVSDGTCRFQMGLRSGMSVSDGSRIRNFGLQWVSDQACRSPMGLRSGMSVTDGSPISVR